MKFQPRRFVVEVKRGTSRAAFTSPDSVSEKFSTAEDLLFGAPAKPTVPPQAPAEAAATRAAASKPRGRVLESLIEPPAPLAEEPPERPRRGRKPGSKNKPKVPPILASPVAPSGGKAPLFRPAEAATFGDHRGFAEDETAWGEPDTVAARPAAPSPERDAAGGGPTASLPGRTRLRDRSSILKRYVLDTEPKPGQPGYLRARRAARTR